MQNHIADEAFINHVAVEISEDIFQSSVAQTFKKIQIQSISEIALINHGMDLNVGMLD